MKCTKNKPKCFLFIWWSSQATVSNIPVIFHQCCYCWVKSPNWRILLLLGIESQQNRHIKTGNQSRRSQNVHLASQTSENSQFNVWRSTQQSNGSRFYQEIIINVHLKIFSSNAPPRYSTTFFCSPKSTLRGWKSLGYSSTTELIKEFVTLAGSDLEKWSETEDIYLNDVQQNGTEKLPRK